ncbi:MAG: hypothetical protein U0325_10150 [Polyangiales bacterium]
MAWVVARSGAPAALGLTALLASSAGVLALGVGVEVRCDATRCAVAAGSLRDDPVTLTFTRDEVAQIIDRGGVTRARPGSVVACSYPMVVGTDGRARALLPREVCPVHTTLDLVHLRQWASGARTTWAARDWIVGLHLGTLLGLLLGGAWVVAHLLGDERITLDPRAGLTVRRGGFASRLRLHLAPAEIAGTAGVRLHTGTASEVASDAPLPSGHLYVETRDGRWHLVTRDRETGERLRLALSSLGVVHRVYGDGAVTARATAMLGRALLGSALWSAMLVGVVALVVAALFDRAVPSLP